MIEPHCFKEIEISRPSAVAERIDRGGPVIGGHGWPEEPGQLDPAVPVGRAHHRDLNILVAEPGDAARPFAFPSLIMPSVVTGHRWHLACEFSNWIHAAVAELHPEHGW